MNETNSTTCPRAGKTTIDEYIDALIQNTAEGVQFWHADMSGKPLRYYYNADNGPRIYITQDWITPDDVMFSLHMAYGEDYEHDSLIASEHTPHDQSNQLRELWLAAQNNLSEEACRDFDLMGYAKSYTIEVKNKNDFDELCRILVMASEEIVELFKVKEN